MGRLITNFNWGEALENQNLLLTRQLSTAYTNTANVLNTKPSTYVTNNGNKPDVDPPANSQFNKNFEVGDFYVRTDTDTAWIMTSRTTAEIVTWTQIT